MYSPTLRTHDVGGFNLGSIPDKDGQEHLSSSLMIPPAMPRYDFIGYCPSSCTQHFLPRDGVKILGAGLHMHMLASGGEFQVSR